MKALSIKQPWALLISGGIKDIENRTWQTKFRGRIYIHASAKPAKIGFDVPGEATTFEITLHSALNHCDEEELYSCIIGEVDIIDCVINHKSIWAEKTDLYKANSKDYPDKIIYNWVLANPVIYKNPIRNVKGKLSFWEPDDCLMSCIACDESLRLADTVEDSGGNYYHQDCYNELAPIMNAEYEEMKRNGEIDE